MSSEEEPTLEALMRRVQEGDPDAMADAREVLGSLAAPPRTSGMPAGWCVIRVELLSGGGQDLNPPPGRDILISPHHTFRQLAELINASFARWDLAHLYAFRMADGSEIGIPDEDEPLRDAARSKLGRRDQGEVFEYEFDFGDGWTHRCTVVEAGVQPEDVYGVRPKGPVLVWGWGSMPDQYGRTTPGD